MSRERAAKAPAPAPEKTRPTSPETATEATWESEATRFALGFLAADGGATPSSPPSGPPPNEPTGSQGLPAGVRQRAETLLGHDFSGVRLHLGARDLGTAHAEASGNQIRLAPGRFRPDHPAGRALLAHELVHVAQQGAAPSRLGPRGRPPGGFEAALAERRSNVPGALLAAQRASVSEPVTGGVTPAPRGLRQRCEGDEKTTPQATATDASSAAPAPPAYVPSAADLPAELRDNYGDIDTQVAALNRRMSPPTPLDADWVRAMQAVETVRGTDPRTYDPLQIGNKGDTALPTLQGTTGTDPGKEDTRRLRESGILDSTVSTAVAGKKQTPRKEGKWDYSAVPASERMTAAASVTGGVAWLFAKAVSEYRTENVETGDRTAPKEHEVVSGDSLSKIAKDKSTTVMTLQQMNPGKSVLQPGDRLTYVEAHTEYRVRTWKTWEQAVKDYNGGGDADYFTKVKAKFDEIKAARKTAEKAANDKAAQGK